jgi:fatty acid desaturase
MVVCAPARDPPAPPPTAGGTFRQGQAPSLPPSSVGDVERVEAAERKAAWFVAVTLALLCVYVLLSAIYGLATHAKPDRSPVGIVISFAAVLVMPYLGWGKRRIAGRIDSHALRGDAAESITCAYMAATVLVDYGWFVGQRPRVEGGGYYPGWWRCPNGCNVVD